MNYAKSMQQLKRGLVEARTKMLLAQMAAQRISVNRGVHIRYGISWKPIHGHGQECLVFKLQRGQRVAVKIIMVSEVVEMPATSSLADRLDTWAAEFSVSAKR